MERKNKSIIIFRLFFNFINIYVGKAQLNLLPNVKTNRNQPVTKQKYKNQQYPISQELTARKYGVKKKILVTIPITTKTK